MADNEQNSSDKKTLGLSKTLELTKRVDAGQIRQSFSHGRSKSVAFEVKKKRAFDVQGQDKSKQLKSDIEIQTGLTQREIDMRMRILREAQQVQELNEKKRQQEEAHFADVSAQRIEGFVQARQREEDRKQQELDVQRLKLEEKAALEAAAIKVDTPVKEESHRSTAKVFSKPAAKSDDSEVDKRDRKGEVRKTLSLGGRDDVKKKLHHLTIETVLNDDDQPQRQKSLAALRRHREKHRHHDQEDNKPIVREVVIPEIITVQELSNRMAVRAAELIKKLMSMGMIATLNQNIDADTAELLVTEFGHIVKRVAESDIEESLLEPKTSDVNFITRAPVVTVMGHVDHGKTSLLDAIRQTEVVSGEAGGITQHIGAYQVHLPDGKCVSFIDTPGHAAFSEMRARGANVTDIVILVVAADDGLKEQTIEAINHAKFAKVPIIVAINKMDKPSANPERVRQELLQHELVVEQMGGDVPCVEISAKQKTNLDQLLETILLVAEVQDLKADPTAQAIGTVIEARMEKGRGAVATVLVQQGTIKVGDIFVAGTEWGRVRSLIDDKGKQQKEAGPSMPIEVVGFSGASAPGDSFIIAKDENKARNVAEYRLRMMKDKQTLASKKSLEELFGIKANTGRREIALIVKSDVQGSSEAIMGSLTKIESSEVAVRILHTGVGGINESDVALAQASNAMIIGFNVRANPQARDLAAKSGVEIRYYAIIYNVIDDIKALLSGLLTPTLKENFLGYAEIRSVFNVTKVGKVAGCYITSGVVKRGAKVRLLRDNVVIHEGSLKTLKRFKEEVKEVKESYECGMAFENYSDIREKDMIECFEVESIARHI